jgi:glucuronate isomerase
MHPFLNHDFLLNSESARRLYLEYASPLPVSDYHTFLSPGDFTSDSTFQNYTQLSLTNSPTKWRAMRAHGVQEEFISGQASDKEKFEQWARIFPYLMNSPVYFQTILGMKSIFGIHSTLNANSASHIYDELASLLQKPEFSSKGLLKKMRVQQIVSALDPVDSLEFQTSGIENDEEVKWNPSFMTDKALNIRNVTDLKAFIAQLQTVSRYEIRNLVTYLAALKDRHDFFHSRGCRLSVHNLETLQFVPSSEGEVARIFDKVIVGGKLDETEILKFESFMLVQFALWDNQKGWVQNLNLGTVRNTSTRMFRQLGTHSGMDAQSDVDQTRSLVEFFDHLDKENCLPKTIVNSSSMVHSDSVLSIIGSFQDGSIRGKMQPGFIDWGLAQPQRVISFQRQVASHSLLPLYIGPPSHGRSVSDLIRHDYFRRILCDYLGNAMDSGNMPADWNVAGDMIKDISLRNAQTYFDISG